MSNQMEGRTSKYLVAPKMSQDLRSTTSVKGRHMSKKILKKQLKRSSKTTKVSYEYEYEMKPRLTWEYADVFCDVSNWHKSFISEDFVKELIKIEAQMTKKETFDVNESSMEITSTGDEQQSKIEGMIEDKPVGSAFIGNVMTHSTAPVHTHSVNVQNDASVNLYATTNESSAAVSDDICIEETFDETTKKSRKSRSLRYRRSLKRTSIKDEITWQHVADDNSEIEATEANIEVFNQVPEMLEHQELFHASANNINTDGVKTYSNQKQYMKEPVQATDPKRLNHTKKKQFKCSDCQKEFSYNKDLIIHMRTHSGEKPFKCTQCPKIYSQKGHLTTHQRIHSGEKPFKCMHCLKKFSDRSNLKVHLRIHSGEKPFKCSECPQVFSRKGGLTTHLRVHTGEQPFKCADCPKMFSQKSHLMLHQRIHSGEQPFKCADCPKMFSQKSHLMLHQRIHSGEKPFKCTDCPKMFSQKPNLMSHQRIHSGEKAFKCMHCLKMFSIRSNLNAHLRIHSGEKPFQCSHCLKAFTSSSNMKRHILTHSTE